MGARCEGSGDISATHYRFWFFDPIASRGIRGICVTAMLNPENSAASAFRMFTNESNEVDSDLVFDINFKYKISNIKIFIKS